MKKITQLIDQALQASEFGNYRKRFFGLSEIVTKKEQHFPVTIPGRQQVALDDKLDLVTWIRVINVNEEDAPEMSYGRNIRTRSTAQLRFVVALKTDLPDAEELINDISKAIPFYLTSPGYKAIFVLKSRPIDFNHEAIYQEELDNTAYSKHRLPWNLYVITLNVQFILC